jgi:phosphoglycerol transferase MdoB-like AlkP superfamily enzyme
MQVTFVRACWLTLQADVFTIFLLTKISCTLKRIILFVVRQFLFWMLFFASIRIAFLGFYRTMLKAEEVTFPEIGATFFHALKLDFATASYFMIFPIFLIIIHTIFGSKVPGKINKIYTGIAVFLYTLISAGEIGLYGEWKIKLNTKALNYLENPSEVYNSAETSSIIYLTFFIIVFTIVAIFVYNRYFFLRLKRSANYPWVNTAIVVILFPLLIIGMRGGLQQIPINQSEVYFSKKLILNHAATNNAFNLAISFIENYKNLKTNPYAFYPDSEAKKTLEDIYFTETDTTIQVIVKDRPNIVLLLMESWSADLIESLGGEPGITPEFHQLEKEGLLFDNMLSSGARSEQAMASVFSGFPAHPISSVTVQPDKHSGLPSLVHHLNDTGYNTSFYFGGQLIYGNIRSYIYYNGFHRIIEGKDFDDANVFRGKLGVHDEDTMDRLFNDLNNEQQPFFSTLFTLSSHSPYDHPMENVFDWGGNENNYINSAFYSDRCLGNFFKKAKKEDWYKNTLFIVVADHSHNSYRNWPFHTEEYHRVPMLWLGGALDSAFNGQRWSKCASQADIASTLLAQLNIENDDFRWSRNLFNPYTPDFKYHGFNNGLIWIETEGSFCYDTDVEKYYWATPNAKPEPDVEKRGKSYLQLLYQDYLDQ